MRIIAIHPSSFEARVWHVLSFVVHTSTHTHVYTLWKCFIHYTPPYTFTKFSYWLGVWPAVITQVWSNQSEMRCMFIVWFRELSMWRFTLSVIKTLETNGGNQCTYFFEGIGYAISRMWFVFTLESTMNRHPCYFPYFYCGNLCDRAIRIYICNVYMIYTNVPEKNEMW